MNTVNVHLISLVNHTKLQTSFIKQKYLTEIMGTLTDLWIWQRGLEKPQMSEHSPTELENILTNPYYPVNKDGKIQSPTDFTFTINVDTNSILSECVSNDVSYSHPLAMTRRKFDPIEILPTFIN